MGLTQLNFEGKNKIETAVELLQACQPVGDYYGAFSGGKDSVVVEHLSVVAQARVVWHYCVSPIDPPEIHSFIKQYHPEVQWDWHARGFWKTVRIKGLPTRTSRWCCEIIKEAGGLGEVVIVGNRRAEGRGRSKQGCFGKSDKQDKVFVRPIFHWSHKEVWEYIHLYNLPYCPLYDEGLRRLGCVMCPMASDFNRGVEMVKFPKIAKLWRLACDRIVADRLSRGNISKRGKPYKHQYKTGQELWEWWISGK